MQSMDSDSYDIDLGDFDPRDFEIGEVSHEIDQILYPAVSDINSIHRDIVTNDEAASEGVLDQGSVDFAVNCIEHGHFGEVPETLHEKAFELMKLLAANHAFADGNKRTALNTTWTFYAMNGYYFDYGEEIKAILKLLAVKVEMVDEDEAISYFSDISRSADDDRAPTEFVKLQHLFAWYEDTNRRIENVVNEANERIDTMEEANERTDIELGEELGAAISEQIRAISSLVKVMEDNEEPLPEGVVEKIESLEERCEGILELLGEVKDAFEEASTTEEFEEELGEILDVSE